MASPPRKTRKISPKPTVKSSKSEAVSPPVRKRKVSRYKSFRLQKRIPHPGGPLPSAWRLLGKTRRLLWANKKTLSLLILLYLLLNLIFVRGFTSPLNVGDVKSSLQQYVGANVSKVDTTVAIFTGLLGTNSQSTDVTGVYQAILFLLFGLSTIWVFRQWSAGNKPTAKDALYQGMYPLIQMLLVISVMVLEFIPAILGSSLYSATVSSGIASNGYEIAIWTLLSSLLVILTLYMLFSSLFAIYVVTLPDMTPMKALRSARKLIFSRRLNVLMKFLVIPLLFVILLVVIVIPTIYFAASFAPWLYFGLTALGALFVNAYLFSLYKELL